MSQINSVPNISVLRSYTPPGSIQPENDDFVYVASHTTFLDGGGGFFYFNSLVTKPDNDGTIVKSDYPPVGRWVRKIDNHVDVRFFGTYGANQIDDGDRIQKAIDYAFENLNNNAYTKGTTVFIPCGIYLIRNTLILKNGVSILGESLASTILTAIYRDQPPATSNPSDPNATNGGHMMIMENGIIQGCNIYNITFNGGINSKDINPEITDTWTKGAILFQAIKKSPEGTAGLWSSTFKNLRIVQFNGTGIELNGGGGENYNYDEPNQLLVFENVHINRQKQNVNSLHLLGQQGQVTFINCGFGGIKYNRRPDNSYSVVKGFNVMISSKAHVNSAVISFINSTFEEGEHGAIIKFAESITFDTCWFETLDVGVLVESSEGRSSKGINILNSRFANAASFGSLKVNNRSENYSGSCIVSRNSEINVHNNFVTITDINDAIGLNRNFITAIEPNLGVNTHGNSYANNRLGYTFGIVQTIPIDSNLALGKYINLKDNRTVLVAGTALLSTITYIECSINAGEIIEIKSSGFPIAIESSKNIYLSGKTTINLDIGDIATFIKLDIQTSIYRETYQLISILKNTTII